jgi:hypothetical protein
VPSHCRMRLIDRDLIRGGHYGQRSCEPHLKAEHMAAPTNPANVKKALANSEPSTHGTWRTSIDVRSSAAADGSVYSIGLGHRGTVSPAAVRSPSVAGPGFRRAEVRHHGFADAFRDLRDDRVTECPKSVCPIGRPINHSRNVVDFTRSGRPKSTH